MRTNMKQRNRRPAPNASTYPRARTARPARTPLTGAGNRRGFSLIEVLLAVVILGLGVISIAALFPAGIAQQRLSNDDVMGPIVADHAISLIRSKVRPSDFGTMEEFANGLTVLAGNEGQYFGRQSFISRTIRGDWDWMRPGYFVEDEPDLGIKQGTVDLFSFYYTHNFDVATFPGFTEFSCGAEMRTEFPEGWPNLDSSNAIPMARRLHGIPYNTQRYEYPGSGNPVNGLPRVLIPPTERVYPVRSQLTAGLSEVGEESERPEYYWDCMFRRFDGRIYVAIFVYRVTAPGGEPVPFRMPGLPYDFVGSVPDIDPALPAFPFRLSLIDGVGTGWSPFSDPGLFPWNIAYDGDDVRALPIVPGALANELDLSDPRQSWQRSRQWILDQNMNVHRVTGRERGGSVFGDRLAIDLQSPLRPINSGAVRASQGVDTTDSPFPAPYTSVPLRSQSRYYYYDDPDFGGPGPTGANLADNMIDRGIVTDIWFIPNQVEDPETGQEFTITPVYVKVKEL